VPSAPFSSVTLGEASEAIVREAYESGAELLVVGDAMLSGSPRRLLESLPGRVARQVRCSVLLARPLRTGELRNVVVGINGTLEAQYGLYALTALSLSMGGRVHLATVVPSSTNVEAAHVSLAFLAE
jgi:nucleotide-binding universal stress UspA family protein